MPADRRDGIINSLFKWKGDKTNCCNDRLITILSVPVKVLAHILLARIQPFFIQNRRPEQSGFTRGRSTVDAILTLRLLCDIHMEFQQPLHVQYIDLKSTFDSVDRVAFGKHFAALGPVRSTGSH